MILPRVERAIDDLKNDIHVISAAHRKGLMLRYAFPPFSADGAPGLQHNRYLQDQASQVCEQRHATQKKVVAFYRLLQDVRSVDGCSVLLARCARPQSPAAYLAGVSFVFADAEE